MLSETTYLRILASTLLVYALIAQSQTQMHNTTTTSHITGAVLSLYTPQSSSQGQPFFILRARDIWYSTHPNWLTFSEPYIDFQVTPNRHWKLHAKRGSSRHIKERIQLMGDVTLKSSAPAPALSLYTQQLILLPQKKQAMSQQHTRIQQNNWQLITKSMTINLNTGHIDMQHIHAQHKSLKDAS